MDIIVEGMFLMEIKVGKRISGFLVEKISKVEDISSTGYLFIHEKSGARLLYLENEDENKVFYAAFKTPPKNSCGTAHIMEHSVLCGSEKYPVKDPFNELAKGSINTYLNALTYADKTVYPVASTSEKDFSNLVKVYLDAVFDPLIKKRKEIFMQEGWHYELEQIDYPLKVTGVVYNEMCGALSSPERQLANLINKSIFGDTAYGYESGGDPVEIPNLTYQSFCDFYEYYYHPSNCYLYLYGKLDIESYLTYIDQEYLSKYMKQQRDLEILPVTKIANQIVNDTYSVTKKTERDSYFALNYVVGSSDDTKLCLSMKILSYLLLGTNSSPLKQELGGAGIGKDAEGWFDESMMEPVFSFVVKSAKEEEREKFVEIVKKTLKTIVEKGFDQSLVSGAFHVFEFSLREEDFGYKPKGLYYGLISLLSWIHGKDPCDRMRLWEAFEEIRKEAEYGYFEKLIQLVFLNNDKYTLTAMFSEEGKQQKMEKESQEALAAKKRELSPSQLREIVEQTKHLKEFQQTEEREEDLKKIPMLSKSDLPKYAKEIKITPKKINGSTVVESTAKTNGIVYFRLLFDTSALPRELLSYAGLIGILLGQVSTERYNYRQIPALIDMVTGNISFEATVYQKKQGYLPAIVVDCRVLEKNIEKAFDLIEEIILHSKYEDRILETIRQVLVQEEQSILRNGHIYGAYRALSFKKESMAYREEMRGISFYRFLDQLEKDYKGKKEEIISKIRITAKSIFAKNMFQSFVYCEESTRNAFEKCCTQLKQNLFEPVEKRPVFFQLKSNKEGIQTTSKVQYNIAASDFRDFGWEYKGAMQVMKAIVNREYLWNQVRVLGGAYGSGFSIGRSGSCYFYSYRDPAIEKTYQVYEQTVKFLEKFQADEYTMLKYIIGVIGSLDRPLSKSESAEQVFHYYLLGVTTELLQKERDEILSVSVEEIKKYQQFFLSVFLTAYDVTIGNKEAIEKENAFFDKVELL